MANGADNWWREAKDQLEVAKILMAAGKLNDAYFHAGQSIEFLLKALYLKRNNLPSMPSDNKGSQWHDLTLCSQAARLKNDLNLASREVNVNWLTVRHWKSNARFPGSKMSKRDMTDLVIAVTHQKHGVWQWLETIYHKN